MKLLFLVVVLMYSATAFDLPAGLDVCKRSDPKYTECIKASVESFMRNFKDGNKAMGLSRLDPISIKKMDMEGAGAVAVRQLYKDIKVYGLVSSKLLDFKINLDDSCSIYMKTLSPAIYMAGKYRTTGQVLLFKIDAEGISNHTFSDLTLEHELTCEKFEKGGEEYLNILDYKISMRPGGIHYEFDTLFPGNAEMSKELLDTLNDNAKTLFEDVRSLQEISYGIVFKQMANNVFKTVPYMALFPK